MAGYSYPVLTIPELVNSLQEMQIEISENDIKSPDVSIFLTPLFSFYIEFQNVLTHLWTGVVQINEIIIQIGLD